MATVTATAKHKCRLREGDRGDESEKMHVRNDK